LATGRFAHQTGNWDNAAPYTGTEAASWGTRLEEAGIPVTTFGKLHYRATTDPTGFQRQNLPLHVKDGVGDLTQLLRGEQPPTPGLRTIIEQAGPGESDYTRYDRQVTHEAVKWLQDPHGAEGPWCAVVSLVSPHYPLIAPPEYFDQFTGQSLAAAPAAQPADWDRHPAPAEYRNKSCLDEPFDDETVQRATAAYYALTSFMDAQLGAVLDALRASGQEENTTVIYLSDHGESLGAHGLWFKSTLHETSLRVPLIVARGDHGAGSRCATPVSLIDVFPTVLAELGVPLQPADHDLPGESLTAIAARDTDSHRPIFSEYHAVHSSSAGLALRRGRWKLHHHVGMPSRLFDLGADPDELHDLAEDPLMAPTLARLEQELSTIVDPGPLNQAVIQDQSDRLDRAGGRDAVLAKQFAAPFTPVPDSTVVASPRPTAVETT
jgi:choline-sulfatase